MSAAWVTREWSENGKRRRAKSEPGMRGILEGDQFVVEWIDPAGKRCRQKIRGKGRVGKRLADERCRQLSSQLALGQYESRQSSTWKEVKERFVRDVLPTKRSERTRREMRETLKRFEMIVKPHRISMTNTAMVDRFIAERLKQKTRAGTSIRNSTVNKDLRNLKAFFRKISKWKLISELPEIELLDETESEKPTYTQDEFVAMYHACDVPTLPHGLGRCAIGVWWRVLLVMFWETGMRRGEMLSLDWTGVNFDRRCLTVNPANIKSKRLKQFNFGDVGEQHLRELAEYGTEGQVFSWPHEVARLNDSLADIQREAGIDPKRRELKFHAFRRTVGETTAELYGLTAAQYKLGHSTAAITAKHYARAAMRSLASKSTMPIPAGLKVIG